jgi:hypothetical protein
MIVESPSPISGRVWRARVRLLLFVGTVVGAIVVIIAMAASLAFLLPRDRAALWLRRSAVPPGDEFAEVNRVSHWPADWIAAVCEPPLYQLRTPYARLPHATAGAVCKARIQPNGEVVNVTIARRDDGLRYLL